MSRKSWKNKHKEGEQPVQKYNWKNSKILNSYEEAKSYRDGLATKSPTKIKRCGVDGLKFAVKVGSPVKEVAKAKKSDD